MATKTADTEHDAPPASAEDPGITIALDESAEEDVLDLKEEVEETPAKETPAVEAKEPAKDVVKPVDVKPEPKTEPKAEVKPAEVKPEPLHPAVREERAKRKAYDKERQFYKGQWEETEREVQRLQARLAQAGMETKATPLKIPKERIDALQARAEKAEGLGQVAAMSLEEAGKLIEEHDRVWMDRFADLQFRTHVKLSEVSSRARHQDYDQVLSTGGVFEAMTQRPDGSYANPVLARMILQDPDPGERAYIIGKGRLIAAEDAKAETSEAEEPAAAVKAEPVAAEGKVEPAKAEGEAEAERRGARAVVERVNANSQKAKGISGLRKAGAVGKTATWTREELDTMMRDQPAKYLQLVERYPDVNRYHLG